jgi:hypothetical protein
MSVLNTKKLHQPLAQQAKASRPAKSHTCLFVQAIDLMLDSVHLEQVYAIPVGDNWQILSKCLIILKMG